MKKTFLLFTLLVLASSAARAQSYYQTLKTDLENYYKQVSSEVQSRDTMPVLYIDTLHCTGYSTFPDYHISDEFFEGYTYDAENKEIEYRSLQYFYDNNQESRSKRYSFYDAAGLLISQVSYDVSDLGQEEPSFKVEYENNAEGNPSLITNFNWTGDWTPSYRRFLSYDANSNLTEELSQVFDGSGWVNDSKYVEEYDANDNQTFSQRSIWQTNAWVVEYEYTASFDPNGNLQEEITSYSFGTGILEPASRRMYFAASGMVDSVFSYYWDAGIQDWEALEKEVRVYNASNEWTESYFYPWDGFQYNLFQRTLYETVDNPFGFTTQNTLSQNWNAVSMLYEDFSKNEYNIFELPDNKAGGFYRSSFQNPPGNGNWQLNFSCDFGFHVDYVTGTKQPFADAPCAMPNPYTTGQWIQCDQLRDNYSYVAQVFSADGKRVYARAFKGGEGWSIERALPEGLYVVLLTHNNKVVSTNKVFIR